MLISFDGLDSSGKATQVSALKRRLQEAGYSVYSQETPDYTTPSGEDLKLRLQGKRGDWVATPWQEKARYFAQNRAEHLAEVEQTLSNGGIVVYDRYVPSSLAFVMVEALAHGAEKTDREVVHTFVRELEHSEMSMPREDVSIFLDVPPRVADELLGKRKETHHEEDEYTDELAVQEGLYREYELLCKRDADHYKRIVCVKEGSLKSVEAIAADIWQQLASKLP